MNAGPLWGKEVLSESQKGPPTPTLKPHCGQTRRQGRCAKLDGSSRPGMLVVAETTLQAHRELRHLWTLIFLSLSAY